MKAHSNTLSSLLIYLSIKFKSYHNLIKFRFTTAMTLQLNKERFLQELPRREEKEGGIGDTICTLV